MRNLGGLVVGTALAIVSGAAPLASQEFSLDYRSLEGDDFGSLRYAVALPTGFDSQRSYPLLLAFPSGRQTRELVEVGFKRYWGALATTRGWIVVSPEAPAGNLFFSGGERAIPALLRQLRIDFKIAGNRMHLAGASNGGRSAFRVALDHPYEFRSLTVFPGYPPLAEAQGSLGLLKDLSLHMFVGEKDRGWIDFMRQTQARLHALGVEAVLKVLPGEGHVLESLEGTAVVDLLESLRDDPASPTGPAGEVAAALDDFHDAAAKGDESRYFGRFAPEGVFLGTDATERWSVAEFRDWGIRYFQRPSAWIYVPQKRWITVRPDGNVAWFDEVVANARLGECRGSGVLRRIDGAWRVCQYNLTLPVPNALADELVGMIRAGPNPLRADTTVYLVRHAEKEIEPEVEDPPLTPSGHTRAEALARALRSVPISAIYVTQFRRTRQTVAPLARQQSLSPAIIPAKDVSQLVASIRRARGKSVLVCGHSDTIPEIVQRLGVSTEVTLTDSDYDNLFVVTLGSDPPELTRFHFGNSPSILDD